MKELLNRDFTDQLSDCQPLKMDCRMTPDGCGFEALGGWADSQMTLATLVDVIMI